MSTAIETPTQEVDEVIERKSLPEILTVDEVAKLLRVNPKTVYAAIRRGDIPGARRIGATIRVSRDVVLRWIDGQADVSPAKKGGAR